MAQAVAAVPSAPSSAALVVAGTFGGDLPVGDVPARRPAGERASWTALRQMTASTLRPRCSASSTHSPDGPGVYLWKDAGGRVLYVGKAKRLRAGCGATSPPISPACAEEPAAACGSSPTSRRSWCANEAAVAAAREQPDQGIPAAVQRAAQGRQELSLHRGDAGGAVPAGAGDPPARHSRRPLLRPLHRRRRSCAGRWRIIRRIYTVRSCADDLPRERRDRPCLDYHIGRCKAPCVGWQTEDEYRRDDRRGARLPGGPTQ